MMRQLVQRVRRIILTICLMPQGLSQKGKKKFMGGKSCENRSKKIRGGHTKSISHSPT
jgi:hypothetical protein